MKMFAEFFTQDGTWDLEDGFGDKAEALDYAWSVRWLVHRGLSYAAAESLLQEARALAA